MCISSVARSVLFFTWGFALTNPSMAAEFPHDNLIDVSLSDHRISPYIKPSQINLIHLKRLWATNGRAFTIKHLRNPFKRNFLLIFDTVHQVQIY
jgi:hypothetical protein